MKKNRSYPKIAFWLLRQFRNKTEHESLFGDYEEMFYLDAETHGYPFCQN